MHVYDFNAFDLRVVSYFRLSFLLGCSIDRQRIARTLHVCLHVDVSPLSTRFDKVDHHPHRRPIVFSAVVGTLHESINWLREVGVAVRWPASVDLTPHILVSITLKT